jgi:hypothetical protein
VIFVPGNHQNSQPAGCKNYPTGYYSEGDLGLEQFRKYLLNHHLHQKDYPIYLNFELIPKNGKIIEKGNPVFL